MVGKIILGILAFLLLALLLILLMPMRVRFTYDGGDIVLRLKFGPVKLQILPRPEKSEKIEGIEKKPNKAPRKEKKKKPKKPKAKINREQIFYALEKLPPILGRAVKRTCRSIWIEPLKVYLLVAGNDPVDTAVLYGRLEAGIAAGLPMLERVIRIKDEDIRLYLDFTQEEMDCAADVGIALRPWHIVTMSVRALASLMKWYLGFRKLASPPPVEDPEEKKEDTSEAA